MAPRRKRLRFGASGELIQFSLSDWEAIQKASGIHFKRPEFARLTLAIMALSYTGNIERTAPYKNALSKIRILAKLVASLRRDFPSVNTTDFVKNIDKTLEYVSGTKTQFALVGPTFLLESFSHMLAQVDGLIANLLKYVNESSEESEVKEGVNWDAWIGIITSILANAGLPTGARKDKRDLGRESPFVTFIREIQARLPQHLFKARTDHGLAMAINRAQNRYPELSKSEVDTALRMWLGAYMPIFGKTKFHVQVEPRMDRNISRFLKESDK